MGVRGDVGLKPSAAARPVRWCSYIPATEPVLQSIQYARFVMSHSDAALLRHHGTLLNKDMEPKGHLCLNFYGGHSHPGQQLGGVCRENEGIDEKAQRHRRTRVPRHTIRT